MALGARTDCNGCQGLFRACDPAPGAVPFLSDAPARLRVAADAGASNVLKMRPSYFAASGVKRDSAWAENNSGGLCRGGPGLVFLFQFATGSKRGCDSAESEHSEREGGTPVPVCSRSDCRNSVIHSDKTTKNTNDASNSPIETARSDFPGEEVSFHGHCPPLQQSPTEECCARQRAWNHSFSKLSN